MTPGILAIDGARSTGWAALRPDGTIMSGTKVLGPEDMRIGPLLHNYEYWLKRLVIEHAPAFIYYEQPWVGPKTAQATALMLMSLAGETHKVGFLQKVTVYPVLNPTVVKHFTGNGGGKRVERKARVWAM